MTQIQKQVYTANHNSFVYIFHRVESSELRPEPRPEPNRKRPDAADTVDALSDTVDSESLSEFDWPRRRKLLWNEGSTDQAGGIWPGGSWFIVDWTRMNHGEEPYAPLKTLRGASKPPEPSVVAEKRDRKKTAHHQKKCSCLEKAYHRKVRCSFIPPYVVFKSIPLPHAGTHPMHTQHTLTHYEAAASNPFL